jgi:ankyrin repeat protein
MNLSYKIEKYQWKLDKSTNIKKKNIYSKKTSYYRNLQKGGNDDLSKNKNPLNNINIIHKTLKYALPPKVKNDRNYDEMKSVMAEINKFDNINKNWNETISDHILQEWGVLKYDLLSNLGLHFCVEHQFISGIYKILKEKEKYDIDIDFYDYRYGNTPLILAIKKDNVSILRILIKYGADYNKTDNEGFLSLHIAAKNGHLNSFKELAKIIPLTITDSGENKKTPLHVACNYGQLSIVNEILFNHMSSDNKNIIINGRDASGEYPIHYAASGGNLCIIQNLLDAGADVNSEDFYGNTPLGEVNNQLPPSSNKQEIVEILTKRGGISKFNNNPTDYYDYF